LFYTVLFSFCLIFLLVVFTIIIYVKDFQKTTIIVEEAPTNSIVDHAVKDDILVYFSYFCNVIDKVNAVTDVTIYSVVVHIGLHDYKCS